MKKYINRDIAQECLKLSEQYPVITITGPRQSGKTTLAKHLFPKKPYVSLEDPMTRSYAQKDPRNFLQNFPEGAIIDEVQRHDELLSYIQGIVDEKEKKGMFILTGSHQLLLHQGVSQSLAGRTALLELLPLSLSELSLVKKDFTLNDYLLNGMFPRVHNDGLNPRVFYKNYTSVYIERDVRQIINVKDLSLFQKFLQLCAGRIGQLFNSSSMSNEVGVSHHTIREWLSILQASFIVFILPPYYENFGKRAVKSGKLYFNDVGLASYLLEIENETQLKRDPLRGNLFENFIILEWIKSACNAGRDSRFYFYRDSSGCEIDLLMRNGNDLIPVEIKSSQTFNVNFFKNIDTFKKIAPDRCHGGYVIYAGDQEQRIHDCFVRNFSSIKRTFHEIYGT